MLVWPCIPLVLAPISEPSRSPCTQSHTGEKLVFHKLIIRLSSAANRSVDCCLIPIAKIHTSNAHRFLSSILCGSHDTSCVVLCKKIPLDCYYMFPSLPLCLSVSFSPPIAIASPSFVLPFSRFVRAIGLLSIDTSLDWRIGYSIARSRLR